MQWEALHAACCALPHRYHEIGLWGGQSREELQDWVAVTLGDLRGAKRGAKKARTAVELQGGGRALLQMSALLAQMRA